MITSEPMNSDKDKWKLVPKNHLILVDHHANVSTWGIYVLISAKVDLASAALLRIAVPLKRFRVAARQWLARARKRLDSRHQAPTTH